MTAPPLDPEKVKEMLSRYAEGARLVDLARDYGLSRSKLYKVILGANGEEGHRELVTDCLVARIAEADAELEDAGSLLEVTKRREQARFARMDFERRRPALYGVKQEVRHTGGTVFRIEYADMPAVGRVVEGTQVPAALPEPDGGEGK